ncbi:hypothetical protein JI747_009545 [Chryseobacterium sp. RG1]|uniref:DUF1648 domain-containing protein n=1 Tax=Chryseobacterium tagetis TaxID=2801334 RepID=A0ABS8A0B2_9FLAO|nr:hypothetical protein [Chryseobacterium tagetis]MCA6067419.1 hypothetical protein [Chryseobacterium tagetis]
MNLHKFIFGLSVLLLLAYSLFLGIKFSSVQEIIPIHYSGEGPDGFGSKLFLWLQVGLNSILLLLIGLIIWYPQKAFGEKNDYLEASRENAIKNRQIFLSVISLVVTLILIGLSLKEII